MPTATLGPWSLSREVGGGDVAASFAGRGSERVAVLVYKILRDAEWAELERAGETDGAPIDVRDGFVHLSTADQVVETAARHFAGEEGLVLLALDAEALGDALRWEPSRGGDLFPHLYRRLRRDEALWVEALPLEGERHRFPDGLA